ncbi:undecaprenyldiphospho-muramoylpentapeptide beta-N- acetylglucosaminyltransferase [Ectopseudomonas mendocina]|uniref:glycosyltransferase n=1 Tax=Ectopseudomonas mendocina TaxID=300 RepID=UPI0005A1794B|nr:glycosyltransferase [Pseudomonas mendocina]SUD27669.1 undecaprenyldiphospho-muramoylpentapeptide beta-N- acetylglucosaminyltransferase [Pseudomonas mendocina]
MIFNFVKSIWIRLPSWRALFYRPRQDTYLFMPINGAGLGHLTRSLAIAKKLKKQKPDAKIVFLTTSIGVTLVHRAGYICHHITPAALLDASPVSWNRLFYATMQNVLAIHRPGTLIFDGTVPYLGLQRAMHAYRSIRYVWVKRGLYKAAVSSQKLDVFIGRFDLVISPGELCDEDEPDAASAVHRVSPVTLLDQAELLTRAAARKSLHLSPEGVCAYIQLGAGNINGVADLQEQLIGWMQSRGIQVVLGSSPISLSPAQESSADQVIVDYPNSQYFAAFDFAVLAAGYNSVCEAVALGLPAIFIPNTQTGADDQVRRSQQTLTFGPYACLEQPEMQQFYEALDRVLQARTQAPIYHKGNGSLEAANLIALR